jgi:hypothetical protein
MDIAKTPALERIARVLAGRELSANAAGAEVSAADGVDATWPAHRDDAYAILRTLREPDEAMAAAGDVAVWERMIAAALGTALPNRASDGSSEEFALDPGTAPFIEGP